jgi:hypothetical protein
LFECAPTAAIWAESLQAINKTGLHSYIGYLAYPPDFLGFLAEISSDDSPIPSRVGSVYFMNMHWEHLDDRL